MCSKDIHKELWQNNYMNKTLYIPLLFVITSCVDPVSEWETHLSYDNYYLEYSECRKIESTNHCNETVKKNDYWKRFNVNDRYLELNTNDASIHVFMECAANAVGTSLNTPISWRDDRDNSGGKILPYPSLAIKEKYDQQECYKLTTAAEFETELKKLKKIVNSQ